MTTAAPKPGPEDEDAEFVRQRIANGQPAFITDPVVYSILDGIMATSTSSEERAGRRRRAVSRSRSRVPYT